MFPTNAPFNGPGSSFDLSQDRLALTRTLTDIDTQINALSAIADPNIASVITPTLGSALAIGLPNGSIVMSGSLAHVGRLSMSLPAGADTYFDVVPTGFGARSDFPTSSLIYQTSGTYQGFYAGVPSALMAQATLDISNGARLWQTYTGQFASPGGGWGPAICDLNGNGYVVRMTSAAGGGLFRAVNFEASGTAMAVIPIMTANQAGMHNFSLGIQQQAAGIEIQIKIDSSSQVALIGIDTSPDIDLTAAFPGMVSDGGSVYLASWSWYNEDGSAPAGWTASSVALGVAPPAVPANGIRFFIVTTGTTPIAIRSVFANHEVATKLAAARDQLNLLSRSYF